MGWGVSIRARVLVNGIDIQVELLVYRMERY